MYQTGFSFEEGVYRTFEEFKNNDPYFKGKVSLLNERSFEFSPFIEGTNRPDPHGWVKMKKILKEHPIWGYSLNGVVYIKYQKNYLRLMKIGAYSLFNFHQQYIFESGMRNQGGPSVLESILEYVLDFETGEIHSLKSFPFERILEKDPLLLNEYMELGSAERRKKNKMAYLLKFNQRHPIYFPTY